jgi:hypothetical protein
VESWWPTELFGEDEAKIIRDKSGRTKTSPTKAVKVRIQCNIGTEDAVNTVFEGENFPQLINGVSTAKPGYTEFGGGSGGLESEGFGGSETLGKVKIMGYEEQEVLSANGSNPAAEEHKPAGGGGCYYTGGQYGDYSDPACGHFAGYGLGDYELTE